MYDLLDVAIAYVVGTAAGLWVFRRSIREEIVTRALDTLVEQDYVRSYVDEEGITQLYKWYELEDVIAEIQREKEKEEDDSP